jgi:hypothetical protein
VGELMLNDRDSLKLPKKVTMAKHNPNIDSPGILKTNLRRRKRVGDYLSLAQFYFLYLP